MGLPKSVRVDEELEKKIEAYLDQNPVKFSQLVAMALEKFISEPQMIELRPVADEDYAKVAKKAFKKHKHTMDKLK
jgi:antitoxin component of RelBE/YafQ-DinJ toxin-antitoxin module